MCVCVCVCATVRAALSVATQVRLRSFPGLRWTVRTDVTLPVAVRMSFNQTAVAGRDLAVAVSCPCIAPTWPSCGRFLIFPPSSVIPYVPSHVALATLRQ